MHTKILEITFTNLLNKGYTHIDAKRYLINKYPNDAEVITDIYNSYNVAELINETAIEELTATTEVPTKVPTKSIKKPTRVPTKSIYDLVKDIYNNSDIKTIAVIKPKIMALGVSVNTATAYYYKAKKELS